MPIFVPKAGRLELFAGSIRRPRAPRRSWPYGIVLAKSSQMGEFRAARA